MSKAAAYADKYYDEKSHQWLPVAPPAAPAAPVEKTAKE